MSSDPRATLKAATATYLKTEAAHEASRQKVADAVAEALRTGLSFTEVTELSPFSKAYVRRIARENDIPAGRPGRKRRQDT